MDSRTIRVGYQISRKSSGDLLAGLETTVAEGASLLEVFLDVERPADLSAGLARTLAERARRAGLPLQLHATYGFADNLGSPPLVETLHLASLLGATIVTVHLNDLCASPVQPDWTLARKLGLVVGVENVPRAGGDPAQVIDYLRGVPDHAPVGVTLDVGHANLTPGGALAYTRSLVRMLGANGRSIVSVHLHDNDGGADSHSVLGTGTIEFSKLLPFLRDEGRCRRFVIERWGDRETCLERARRWLDPDRV